MRVSLIIPVFNGAQLLPAAIESALPQIGDGEILVIDDGSTDGSAAVAESLGARCIRQENRGLAGARNTGLRHCKGEWIAFLDCDDVWPAGRQAALFAAVERHPKARIIRGRAHVEYTDPASPRVFARQPEQGAELLSFCTALVHRSVFDQVGLMEESLALASDVDWLLRAGECGVPSVTIPDITLIYRRHQGNMTNDVGRGQRYFARVLKRSLDRRRAAAKTGASSSRSTSSEGAGLL